MLLFGLKKGETDAHAIWQEIHRLETLVEDLWKVTMTSTWARRDIPDGPLLERWQHASRTVPCLMGLSTGHPKLTGEGRPIITSDLVLFSESAGLARTQSRWYRLGRKIDDGGPLQ